ncbi:Helicase protein MOM1 [Bienertia sinuspersici]
MQRSEVQPDCNTKVPRYIEYWVPVRLSYVQLEKYCETLIKNSMLLCSCTKKEVLDGLHEVLSTIRKVVFICLEFGHISCAMFLFCCDHPYLVDSSLQKFINDRRPSGDYLSNGIEVSGKLLLLDKLLQEVKEKRLRVLIVFQSNNSKSESNINLQHILDDLICQKIGEECYVHIYREFDSTKKRAVVDVFNDKENRKLVMLIEKSSCQPSIKLSSMDCVILFNSDWSPINDMKPLRKMSIQSNFDHLKVFRLYSSNSVEEKALTLVKEGVALENNLDNFSYNISHKLLLWGTSYLFSKLDELHKHYSSIADINNLSEDKLVFDALNELSAIICCQDSNNISCSLISKVPEGNADYSQNISLHGEQDEPARDDDLPPYTVWSSLLEGRNPLWKLLPGSAEKIRRRGELLASASQCAEDDQNAKSKKSPHSGGGLLCSKVRVGKVRRLASTKRAHNIAGHPKSHGNAVKLSSCIDDCISPRQIEETCLRRMRELILKQKKQIREFYRAKREDRKRLDEEHQLEVGLVNQRYKETTLEQQQLKKLDIIYEQKLEEHNRQMDTKMKELEDQHLASRVKVKQLKDKLFTLLKTKNLKTPTTSLAQHPVDLTENSSDSTIMISNTSVSESNHSQEIKQGMVDSSLQCDDRGNFLDHELIEKKTLSVECDEDNHTVSMPREEVSDTAESGTTATVAGQQRIKEGQDGDFNIEASIRASNGEAEMRSAADSGAIATVAEQKRVEEVHDGDCNIKAVSGGSDTEAELRVATDSATTATVAVQQRIEEMHDEDCNIKAGSGESNREAVSMGVDSGTSATVAAQHMTEGVLERDHNTSALNGECNGEADLRGAADSGTTATVAAQQRIEGVQERDCKTNTLDGESNEEADLGGVAEAGTRATVFAQQRIDEMQDGSCNTDALNNGKADLRGASGFDTTASVAAQQRTGEVLDENCNANALIGESNGEVNLRVASDLSAVATVAGQQRIEEVQGGDCNIEAHTVASNGEAEMIGAAGATTIVPGQQRMEELIELTSSRLNVSSQVLSMASANLQCFGTSSVSNCQNIGVHAPCEQGQTQVPLGNLGSYNQPVLQAQLQTSAGQEQPCLNSGTTTINQSINRCFEESQSSLRSNLLPSVGSDPIRNELLRMNKELEEAVKIHEEKSTHLKSACEKEIQDIKKKYDVLLWEAENALSQKKLELGSHFRKVYANLVLADTLKSSNQRQTTSSISSEDLLSAILQISQFNLPVQSSGMETAAHTPPPVQVVNQLSELITFDATTPHTISISHDPGNSVAGYHARASAPHLCPPPSRPVTFPSMPNMLTSFYGVDQQTASWHQPGSSFQFRGIPQNPLLL